MTTAEAARPQHVEIHRKVGLRRKLLELVGPGAAWVPFCGEGDLIAECYGDREVWAADIDPAKVETLRERRPDVHAQVHDCDTWGPWLDAMGPVAVMDADSWSYPYAAIRSWWEHGQKADRVAIFGTDDQRQAMNRTFTYRHPDGTKVNLDKDDVNAMRKVFHSWWTGTVKPFLTELFEGWEWLDSSNYMRGKIMYWGVVIERPGTSADTDGLDRFLDMVRRGEGPRRSARESGFDFDPLMARIGSDPGLLARFQDAQAEADEEVHTALRTAAASGNVTAALAWQNNRPPSPVLRATTGPEEPSDTNHTPAPSLAPHGAPIDASRHVKPAPVVPPQIRSARKRAFLAAYSEVGIVSKAADAAGVNRTVHYQWLEADPVYAEAFAIAREYAVERLETEAWRRAVEGVEEPVYHQGRVVGTVRRPSDTLMIFLLKAANPDKYRDRQQVEHTGGGGGPIEHVHRVATVLDRAREIRAGRDVIDTTVAETNGHTNGHK